MKRFLLAFGAMLLVGVFAFAAGQQDSSDTEGGESKELVVFANDAYTNQATFRQTLDAFDEQNPDIELDIHEHPPDESYRLAAVRIASGDQLDILRMTQPLELQRHVSAGALLPLDDYAAAYGLDPEEYYGASASSIIVDGSLYMIPNGQTQWLLYYNKALFDEAGIEYPSWQEPMTWTEYQELAERLTMGEGSDKTYGALHMLWPMYWYGSAIQQLGGGEAFYTDDGLSNITHPAFRESIKRYHEMQAVDESVPAHSEIKSRGISATAYMNGDYAMYVHGTWLLGWMKNREAYPRDFEIGIAPMPVYDGAETKYSWGVVNGLSVTTASNYPEEAFRLAKFMTDNLFKYSTGDMFFPNQNIDTQEILPLIVGDLQRDGMTEDMAQSVFFDPEIIHVNEKITGPNAVEYERIAEEETEKYFVGAQSLDEAIENIKTRADRLLSN